MYLGIDTSNYTTSAALYDGEKISQTKQILAVKAGEKGLRQSDALFQHTVNLPALIKKLDFSSGLDAVGVSTRPRNLAGSYMPCFLAGISAATAVSSTVQIPLYETSHQIGHILAALYSVGRLDLIQNPFAAFHVSGGTTEALYVTRDRDELLKTQILAQSSDLKAGQAVDRTGVMLGLDFPCGKELDALSLKSSKEFKVKPSFNGLDFSLSGVENKARQMFERNEPKEDIAKFVLTFICETISETAGKIIDHYGDIPLLFMGGVMSNTLIRTTIQSRFNAYFADPEFSCDNAAGIAVYAYLKDNNI